MLAQRSGPEPISASLRARAATALLRAAPAGLSLLVIVLLVWPMASTSLPFGSDWPHHLWLIEHTAETLRLRHHPSLYTNDSDNVLYPNFAFYGATTYSVLGLVALLLGSARNALVVACALALAASYGGWYWLGRMAGLGRWTAQLPSILAVTAPFALTVVYDRGDLAEFVAVAVMPLLAASIASVLRADRLHAAPALALAVSVVVFFGTHNLTVLWGGTALVLMTAAVAAVAPPVRGLVTRAGVLRVLAVAVPALLVDAWFLIPDLAYQSQTWIVSVLPQWRTLLHDTMLFVASGSLFRLSGDGTTSGDAASASIHTALPLLAIGWAAVAAVLVAPRTRRSASARVLLVLCALGAALVVLMTRAELILALPKPYTLVQFSFRIESEVLLAVIGATVAGLVAVRAAGGRVARWSWALAPVAAFSLVAAVIQTGDAPRDGVVRPFYAPPSPGLHNIDYSSVKVPLMAPAALPMLRFSPAGADGSGRVTAAVVANPGEYVQSNLAAAPDLVAVEGARVVANSLYAGTVLQIDADRRPGVQRITASEAHPWPVGVGRAVSLLGLLGLTANAVLIARAGRRRRRVSAGG